MPPRFSLSVESQFVTPRGLLSRKAVAEHNVVVRLFGDDGVDWYRSTVPADEADDLDILWTLLELRD
jgi:hypothetical protein